MTAPPPSAATVGGPKLVPISQRAALAWVKETHRHLKPPRGDLWRAGLEVDGSLVAVGIAGRPCRMLQDGTTAEFTRIASAAEVAVNACSRLYGALRRAGQALGYRRFVTYTLEHEPGTSLRAAGFHDDGLTDGGEWDRPSRPRDAAEQPGRKRRWIWPGRDSGLWQTETLALRAAGPGVRPTDGLSDDAQRADGRLSPRGEAIVPCMPPPAALSAAPDASNRHQHGAADPLRMGGAG